MSRQDCNAVLDTLSELIRINSINPNYPGGVSELAMAEYVERFFQQRGIETWRQNVFSDRPNLIARVPGLNPERRIVLEAHMDTVAVTGMAIDAWDPKISDGLLYGRGSCDTKGGMAAMMHAVARLVANKTIPYCDVWFAATIDEEYSFRGVLALCEPPFHADAAIIAEPTELQPVVASKGLVRWKIETLGKAAHSAKPHLGRNAIEYMARIIMAIQQDTTDMACQSHPLLGSATCNIGVVRGGVQINFVPDRCEIEIDRRLLPGEQVSRVLRHYQSLVDSVAKSNLGMQVVMHPPMLTDTPLETDPNAPAVQTMVQVLRDLGLSGKLCGVPFCSDASKFAAVGIPSIIFGPGSIDQAHSSVEFVSCSQVVKAAEIYHKFLTDFKPEI